MFNYLQKHVKLLIFVSVFLFAKKAEAQNFFCLTPTENADTILKREQKIVELKQKFANARIAASPIYVPIKAHIIRNSDGSGGLNLSDLNTALTQTNALFINAGIQFYFCGGSPHYINNSQFYDFDNSEETALCSANDVYNAINIYFPNIITFGSYAVSGYAYFPNGLAVTNRVFIQASAATDTRTIPHELGHYFNLYHTFQGSTISNYADRELVTRSASSGANCSTKGDFLCDTPSDPFGRPPDSTQVLGCSYQGNAKDAQGQLYSPDLGNIMSYYPTTCGNHFSSSQYSRIADGLLLRLYGAYQYTLDCSPTVTGANVPSSVSGTIGASGVTLNFNDNSTNEMGFIIERSTTSATDGFVPIAGLAPNITNHLDQNTTAFTTYYYKVKASNSSSQYSAVSPITTTLSYCPPLYTYSCSATEVLIDDFILKDGSIDVINNSNSNCSPNNYGTFTNTPYNVEAGKTYSFIARAISGGMGTYFDQHATIWIDYGKDGVFDNSDIVYQSNGSSRMNPSATGSFTIPSNVSGVVRLRIRSGFASYGQVTNPCSLLVFGEVEDYHLNIINSTPTISSVAVSPTMVCAGQNIAVSFTTNISTSTSYQVQLSDASGNNFANISTPGTGSPISVSIPISTPSGNGYKVRVISSNPAVTSTNGAAFSINAIPSPPSVVSPVSYQQGQTATALAATGSNLKWYSTSSGGTGNGIAPVPSTASIGSTSYYVSQTINNCESQRATIQVNVANAANIVACLNLKAFLEGPYTSNGQMNTSLNIQGLLPGQTPADPFAPTNTPAGQPYNISPWNYAGSETMNSYGVNVVDWVLVSLRSNPEDKATTIYKTAALLNKNGTISTVSACPTLSPTQSYYVTIDHRNHIGAVSHQAVPISNGQITYDFTIQDSYIPSSIAAFGQKKSGSVYMLYAADCLKNSIQDINNSDNNQWRKDNGKISVYAPTDINMDGVIDLIDKLVWRKNNGKYSGVDF